MLTAVGLALRLVAAAPSFGTSTESIGVLPVAPPPGADPELVEINDKLRAELSRRVEGVLSASDLAARMEGRGSTASLSELERAFGGAQEELKKDPSRGIDWLRVIRTELQARPDSAEAFDLWKRVTLRLARARLEYATSAQDAAAGQAEARQLADELVRAQPDLVIDPLEYSRRLERLVAEARAAMGKAPRHRLTVTSSGEDTIVFVNGRDVGKAPVSLTLASGQYRVSGLRGSLSAPAEVADLRARDQAVRLDFSLLDVFRPRLGPGLAVAPGEADRTVLRAAVWLGLDRVVTTMFHREKDVPFLVAKVLDVKPHATVTRQGWVRLSGSALPIGGAADLAGFLLTGKTTGVVEVSPPLAVRPERAARLDVQGGRGEDVAARAHGPSRRTWAYVAGGTGVALLAGGAVAGLQARAAYDREKSATTSSAYDSDRSKAKSMSAVADVLFVAGGAGLVVGGWLYFTSQPAPVAIGVSPAPGGAVASLSGGF